MPGGRGALSVGSLHPFPVGTQPITSLKTILTKYEKKKKTYRKDYYPNYNKLVCRTAGCVPTGKGCKLPTERPPSPSIVSSMCMTEVTSSQESNSLSTNYNLLKLLSP
ncbi:hypothetical protein AYI68_g1192 [Smittium mucronatum]|uniref:Uncharacterized protein n=1 Tax=Smittium mucronatum TaxID=133383 RepID=A0A1R0H627_9FUNG|nr:hypothetical protein AYI68_g1192 [Smittium mucronatum]